MAVQTMNEVFDLMGEVFDADKAEGVDAIFQFELSGDDGGTFWVKVKDGAFESGDGAMDEPNVTIISSVEDYISVVNGETAATTAVMMGKIKIKGDMTLALKLQTIFPFN